ncbi:pseudouridine synthase [Ureibacillus massiliensis 4400831 = CIP 108448 = CCUG 49529]|uniref:Pseudouridine synthase n=1 Tax=Ureibacillus massiliensis 4400831 = CIP 108448 = CCUG 49529 TaxID=1211035 RepID=A0A0A3JV18_9BACL|nr:RluA family pseudouridine synthase [Ureibacillus massiliensis]KGR90827.1 pseudouridine synthase [Ureibacillus massiliensis 4400831 = CIP 108448 = CCUG 49529]
MFQYEIVQNDLTIEELLRSKWRLGKKLVHELRMAKAITLENGEQVLWSEKLKSGTTLSFTFDIPKSNYVPTKACEVEIQYEDDHCLIVSKPKGMATHPNDIWDRDTCMNHVIAHIQSNGGHYAEHVHRLDRGTKGLLLIAKHPIAKSIFDRMIEEKTIIRTYEAEVQGSVRQDSGTISEPIGKDRHHATRRVVAKTGQHAVTHFKVVKRLKQTTIVHLTLETGRTHQIRVHMAHLGHPIVGDTMYNARKTANDDYELHAIQLEFEHPFLNKLLVVKDKGAIH